MRTVGIAELRPGDRLGKPVLGNNGIVMLEAGTVLTEQYISRLRALSVKYVTLSASPAYDALGDEIKNRASETAISWERPDIQAMKNDAKAREEAIKLVAEYADRSLMVEQIVLPFPEEGFRKRYRDILREIARQPALTEELGVMMLTDRILFEHALNVSLCASVLGTVRGFDQSKLYELTLGALFSDIGMTRLPVNLTKAKRELNESEMKILRQHTSEGYRVLKGMKEVPHLSAQCALLHHERYRGSGYPLGMKQEDIPEYARIVAISDVYNALGSPRHHRNAYGPAEAIEYLFASGNYDFESDLIKSFLNQIIIYPVSTNVRLSSGQLATVTETQGRPIQRPLVHVYREADGKIVEVPYPLELRTKANVVIMEKAGE